MLNQYNNQQPEEVDEYIGPREGSPGWYLNQQKQEAVARQQAQAEAVKEMQQRAVIINDGNRAEREIANMTTEERQAWNDHMNAGTVASRLAQQARSEAEQKFLSENEAMKQRELTENSKRAVTSQHDRTMGVMEAQKRAQERAAQWAQARLERERLAEGEGTEVDRLLATLGDDEKQAFVRLLQEQDKNKLQTVFNVKATVAERNQEKQTAALLAAYRQEVAPHRGNLVMVTNIQLKYRQMGLEV